MVAGLKMNMLRRFRRVNKNVEPAQYVLTQSWNEAGISYQPSPNFHDWLENWSEFGADSASVAFLAQCEELGFAERIENDLRRYNAYFSGSKARLVCILLICASRRCGGQTRPSHMPHTANLASSTH
jgi:hypothetical protein